MSTDAAKEIRPDRVSIYIRWSTEEQGEGTTLLEQREGCEFYVRSQGWFVNPELVFIDDGYSGGTLDRPGMRQVRDLIQRGEVDCVVVFKIDRLSRNIVDATQLVLVEWKDHCHLRCVRQPIDTTSETGRMIFSVLATFADFERAQITERTYHGRLRRLKEGKAYGGPSVPYGLLATGEPGVRQIDPVLGPVIAELYRKVRDERATVQDLATWLQERGIRPHNGKLWRYNTLRHILSNPIYAGRIVYGRDAHVLKATGKSHKHVKRSQPLVEVAATTVPAVVTPEIFDDVQAILAERGRFHKEHRRASDGTNLLSGVATCRCGASIISHRSRESRYYICGRRVSYRPNGCTAENGTLHAERVEQAVVDELLAVFGDRNRRLEAARMVGAQANETVQVLQRELAKAAAEIGRVDDRLKELRAAASLGDLALNEWRDLRSALEDRRASMVEEHKAIEQRMKCQSSSLNEEALLVERMALLDRWASLAPVEQKALLREFTEKIVMFKPRGWKKDYEIKIVWRFDLQQRVE